MKAAISGAVAMVITCSVSLAAQWPKYQAPFVPRDAKTGARTVAVVGEIVMPTGGGAMTST